jgi:hypothetical protein
MQESCEVDLHLHTVVLARDGRLIGRHSNWKAIRDIVHSLAGYEGVQYITPPRTKKVHPQTSSASLC